MFDLVCAILILSPQRLAISGASDMSNLIELQNKFQHQLLDDENTIYQDIVNTKNFPVQARLGIYSEGYRARLGEALAVSYPVLHTYLGDAQFEKLSLAYIAAHPSHFRSIRWFGDQLADFLRENPPFEAFPYLAELAQFEWGMTLVFDAANEPVITLEELESISSEAWSEMYFIAHPSVKLLSLSWNVVTLWQNISRKEHVSEPIQSGHAILWALWRQDLISCYCSLGEVEAYAIDGLLNQLTYEQICEGLCQWIDKEEAALHAASLLKGWVSTGLISEIRFKKDIV